MFYKLIIFDPTVNPTYTNLIMTHFYDSFWLNPLWISNDWFWVQRNPLKKGKLILKIINWCWEFFSIRVISPMSVGSLKIYKIIYRNNFPSEMKISAQKRRFWTSKFYNASFMTHFYDSSHWKWLISNYSWIAKIWCFVSKRPSRIFSSSNHRGNFQIFRKFLKISNFRAWNLNHVSIHQKPRIIR